MTQIGNTQRRTTCGIEFVKDLREPQCLDIDLVKNETPNPEHPACISSNHAELRQRPGKRCGRQERLGRSEFSIDVDSACSHCPPKWDHAIYRRVELSSPRGDVSVIELSPQDSQSGLREVIRSQVEVEIVKYLADVIGIGKKNRQDAESDFDLLKPVNVLVWPPPRELGAEGSEDHGLLKASYFLHCVPFSK